MEIKVYLLDFVIKYISLQFLKSFIRTLKCEFFTIQRKLFLTPMTRSSVHATHLADHFTSDRSVRILGILAYITLFFSKSIYAANPVNELKSLQTLSFEASGCAPEILRAICSALSEKDKLKINLQSNAPMVEYSKMHGHMLGDGNYQKIRSLDLSNLGIDDLPAFIFEHMTNLESLNLSGNAKLNLNSETFESLCQQLTELDVSGCNIDESDFSIICSNCPKLKILRVSRNPRIKFPGSSLAKFKDTLEELRIDSCDLDTADMLKIARFKSIGRLDISNNWLKEFFEKLDLGNLKDTLTELRAPKVGITSENLCKITECSKITVLDIGHNNLKNERFVNPHKRGIFRALTGTKKPPNTGDIFLGGLSNRLTSLNVSRANLNTGQLRDILDFPSIETLDCSCNDFSRLDDTFEIGRAKDVLRDASFSKCYIKSPKFLEEILNCQSLVKLNISKNSFNIPYNKLALGSSVKSLKWIDISGCEIDVRLFIEILGKSETIEYLDISGKIPTLLWDIAHTPMKFDFSEVVSTIGGLKKSLKTLKASNCKLENDYPLLHSLTDCERLEHLDISRNNLSQLPADFQFGSSGKTLKYLNMNNCGYIRMNTLRAVTDLKVLEVLNMDNNKYEITQECFGLGASKNSLKAISIRDSFGCFNLSILQAISECRVLETLDLYGSDMDGFEFGSFDFGAAKSSLRKINMNSCRINSEVLVKAVFDCEKLEELSLGNNDLSNLSEDFKVGNSRHSLKILKMNCCQLRGQNILFESTDCSNLKQLYFFCNNFAVISTDFKFGKSKDTLEIIDMSSCRIQSEKVLSEITNCSNLKELDLSRNNFRNISARFSFGSSRHSLKVLRMDRCGMINLFTAVTSCEVLEKLSVRGNSFSSYNFGESRNTLKDLDISENSFSEIKDFNQISDCKRLEKLNISYIPLSQFEQELNSENFNMPALKELISIHCRLTRPSSLIALTIFPKLEKINISSNNFDSFPDDFSLGISKDTLTKITAEDYSFSDKHIIKALTDCKRLEVLMLYRNKGLKECGKVAFGISTNSLKELDLRSCKIDLLIWIDEIKKCIKMHKLNLLGNDLSRVTSEFDYDGFRDSIGDLDINCCGITRILASLAKYHRLEDIMMIGCDLQGIDQSFKFGNLAYTLKDFSLDGCKNFDANDKQKILGLFKFLERQ